MKITAGSDKKQKIAYLTIGLSILALILGLISRTPIFNTFSFGAWVGFVSFLLSLGSVEDSGSNFLAKIDFWSSFAAMCITIFLGTTG